MSHRAASLQAFSIVCSEVSADHGGHELRSCDHMGALGGAHEGSLVADMVAVGLVPTSSTSESSAILRT